MNNPLRIKTSDDIEKIICISDVKKFEKLQGGLVLIVFYEESLSHVVVKAEFESICNKLGL